MLQIPNFITVMNTLSLTEWKTFLNARALQEKGDDQKALEIFEELLLVKPANPHLQSSRAFALERLGRGTEAIADRIALKYAELGRELTGDSDKPEAWTSALSSLLGEVENAEAKGVVASALVAW